jgi:hypothetical protein
MRMEPYKYHEVSPQAQVLRAQILVIDCFLEPSASPDVPTQSLISQSSDLSDRLFLGAKCHPRSPNLVPEFSELGSNFFLSLKMESTHPQSNILKKC